MEPLSAISLVPLALLIALLSWGGHTAPCAFKGAAYYRPSSSAIPRPEERGS